jgi:hypothetical protein
MCLITASTYRSLSNHNEILSPFTPFVRCNMASGSQPAPGSIMTSGSLLTWDMHKQSAFQKMSKIGGDSSKSSKVIVKEDSQSGWSSFQVTPEVASPLLPEPARKSTNCSSMDRDQCRFFYPIQQASHNDTVRKETTSASPPSPNVDKPVKSASFSYHTRTTIKPSGPTRGRSRSSDVDMDMSMCVLFTKGPTQSAQTKR